MDGTAPNTTTLRDVELDLIDESPTNPRRIFDEAKLNELAESIRAQGVLQPVRLRPHPATPGRFELVYGTRRKRASVLAGLRTIPATVREMTDLEVAEAQIIENRDRDDVHPLDEADAIAALHRTHRVSVDDIAARLGRTTRYVTDRLLVAEHLSTEARESFARGGMTLGAALVAARLPADSQAVLVKECGWMHREVTATDARDIVLRRVSLSLANPPFDTNDATLPGGSCAACPKRSGRQPGLFDEGDTNDVCLSRPCYELKRETTREREVQALADAEMHLEAAEKERDAARDEMRVAKEYANDAEDRIAELTRERDAAEQRANRLALDINTRDAILDRADAKLGWPSSLSVMSHWRDRMCTAVDETAGKISKLENLVAQARESYPRAEVLRMLDAAGAPTGGIVQRVAWLIERVATLTQERDAARLASTPNEREVMLRAALDNREAYARDLAALVTHSDQRIAELAQEIEGELADARAIIAGRTTAPTAAEAALHRRRGGTWLVLLPVESGWRQVEFPDVVAKVWGQREGVRWTAVDAERRFTAWPTVTP